METQTEVTKEVSKEQAPLEGFALLADYASKKEAAEAAAAAQTETTTVEEGAEVETEDKEEKPITEPAQPNEVVEGDDWEVNTESPDEGGEKPAETEDLFKDVNTEFGYNLKTLDDAKSTLRTLVSENKTLAEKQDEIKQHFTNSEAQFFAEVLQGTQDIVAANLDNPKQAIEAVKQHIANQLTPFLSDPSGAPKTELAKYALMTTKFKGKDVNEASSLAQEHLESLDENAIEALADVGLDKAKAELQTQREAMLATAIQSMKARQLEKQNERKEVEKAMESLTELPNGFKLKTKVSDGKGGFVTKDRITDLKRAYQLGNIKLNVESYRDKSGNVDYSAYAMDAAKLMNFDAVASVAANRGKSDAIRNVIKDGKNITKTTMSGDAKITPEAEDKNKEFLAAMQNFGKL